MNKSQIIRNDYDKSNKVHVSSGVLQGSDFGPLRFNILINGIHSCFCPNKILLFADHLKLLRIISNIMHCGKLQNYPDNLYNWRTLLHKLEAFCKENIAKQSYSWPNLEDFLRTANNGENIYWVEHWNCSKLG